LKKFFLNVTMTAIATVIAKNAMTNVNAVAVARKKKSNSLQESYALSPRRGVICMKQFKK